MFDGFANVWTPVVLGRSLGKKPLPLRLANEPLVFFRDAKGIAHALIDRCPHRGVALSLGHVSSDGALTCAFHAWEFGGDGTCLHVPLNPDAKRDRLFAQSIPVREIGGVLWAYTAVTKTAPSEPVVPDGLTMPGLALTAFQVEWKAHWTRAMENMLDSPHVPYVHATTIGRFIRPYLKRDSKMIINWEDTDFGGKTSNYLEDRPEGGATLDFYKPNMMVLHIPIPNRVFRMHAFSVPIDDTHVRMIIVGVRSFAKFPGLSFFFNRTNMKIAAQDKAIVESSQPLLIPRANEEHSVRTDRATLQFRKYFYEQLYDSVGAQPQ